ncbi:hypothetical protein N802_10470 [Knoellia sinensis KCTC 19936]|uniref:Uncharacterized protein n=1 Tax=Knoellia sinensis KCTC 19936 TaxID=1385520 RepID=A0A0A0J2F7_9MICO|nr:hypothetical protein [Knoellia sinensis]KGN29841.1 hypothetical protein N802_10470 [Knoellia sinensis KCTC 19936]
MTATAAATSQVQALPETPESATTGTTDRGPRLVSLAGGLMLGGAGLGVLFTNPIPGETGAAVTAALAAQAGLLQALSILAVFGAAALLVAAARLAARLDGVTARVASGAGVAVALLGAMYVSSFGAGSMVGTLLLTSPGPGLGEATLVSINVLELTRYAPSLAVTAAAVVGRRHLSRPLVVSAAVLAVLIAVPFTSWAAAIVVPLWLGLAGATISARA